MLKRIPLLAALVFAVLAVACGGSSGGGLTGGGGSSNSTDPKAFTAPVQRSISARVQSKASAQMKTSSAAEPAATHKRKAELPISGSTPNI